MSQADEDLDSEEMGSDGLPMGSQMLKRRSTQNTVITRDAVLRQYLSEITTQTLRLRSLCLWLVSVTAVGHGWVCATPLPTADELHVRGLLAPPLSGCVPGK